MRPACGRLRILAVISSSRLGGAERCLATLLKELARQDVEISVACHGQGPMCDEYRAVAAQVWPLDLSNPTNPSAALRLAGIARRTGADIIHTHLWNADVLGGLAARLTGIPAVSTVHGAYHLPLGAPHKQTWRQKALSGLYRAVYRAFDRVIAVSSYVRDDLRGRAGLLTGRTAIDVIYSGLDLSREEVPHEGEGPPAIINVANLFPMKGQEWLLRALPEVLERFPKTRCVLIGDGPERTPLETLAKELAIGDNVLFAGSASSPWRLARGNDIFVLPSLSEGFGLAILEAWARGLPVIASRVGGIPEVVEDGRTGLLVAPRDRRALVQAVVKLLCDPALAGRLADQGRRALPARFSAEVMAGNTLKTYRSVLEARALRR